MPSKQVTPRDKRKSRAPYNFVPMATEPYIPEDQTVVWDCYQSEHSERFTGYFTIEIEAETDLYVRCAPALDKVEKEPINEDSTSLNRTQVHRQDFFHQGQKLEPYIPGSSLRGSIRNLVEIMSHSRMSKIDNSRFFFREFAGNSAGTFYKSLIGNEYPDLSIKAGYIVKDKGDYFIQPALQHNELTEHNLGYVLVKNDKNLKSNKNLKPNKFISGEVYINSKAKNPKKRWEFSPRENNNSEQGVEEESSKDKDKIKGVLVVPLRAPSGQKYLPFVFCKDENPNLTRIKIPKNLWDIYKNDERQPRMENHRGRILKVDSPVFYRLKDGHENLPDEEKLEFFGSNRYFRFLYEYTPQDLIPDSHKDKASQFDLTEMIFGTVRETNSPSSSESQHILKGRVCFHDSKALESEIKQAKSPKILSSPKPTAFQHYLVQNSDEELELKHWSSGPEKPELRGYKLYWHKKKSYPYEQTLETRKSHTVIKPVSKKAKFKGKVSFENLNYIELGALIAALELPDDMRHKIGMGKPYGMGSIKIKPILWLENRQDRYKNFFSADQNKGNKLNSAKFSEEDTVAVKTIKKTALSEFTKAIIDHHDKVTCEAIEKAPLLEGEKGIWQIPRLGRELRTMLSWIHSDNDMNKDYMRVRAYEWRSRNVLPSPQDVVTPPTSSINLEEKEQGSND